MSEELPEVVAGDRKAAKRKIGYALKDLANGRALLMELTMWYQKDHPEISSKFFTVVEGIEAIETYLTSVDSEL